MSVQLQLGMHVGAASITSLGSAVGFQSPVSTSYTTMCTCICQPRSVSALQITSPMLAMSTMADDVEATLAEVRNVSRLLGTEGFRGAADALLRSLCTRIASTPLDVGAASRVATVVGECSFTPRQKSMILAAASARVSTTVALRRSSSSLGQRPAPQHCQWPNATGQLELWEQPGPAPAQFDQQAV